MILKYNAYKVFLSGDGLVMATGVGEPHALDHVMELMSLCLEINEQVHQLSDDNEKSFQLRIGIHMGQAKTCFVHLGLGRLLIEGEAMETAVLIHGCSIAGKLQASEAIYQRLCGATDMIHFIHRGSIETKVKKKNGSSILLFLYFNFFLKL